MKWVHASSGVLLVLGTAALFSAGCGQARTGGKAPRATANARQAGDDSASWWCREHGVPEHMCGQCNASLAADLKKKGDWCKEHDRPESQCFVCHPDLEQKFASQYEAKFGKKPPERAPEREDE